MTNLIINYKINKMYKLVFAILLIMSINGAIMEFPVDKTSSLKDNQLMLIKSDLSADLKNKQSKL